MAFVDHKDGTAADGGGGRITSPAAAPTPLARLVARARNNVWTPLALRIAAIGIGMLALAGIGAASILSGLDGVHLPADVPMSANIGSAWLALHHENPAPSASTASTPEPECGDAGTPDAPHAGITKDGKVILNVASAEELTKLPGVGPKRAQKIVELRERLKRFRRPSDLLRVRGIGPRGLKRMLPHLVLDPPTEGDAGSP